MPADALAFPVFIGRDDQFVRGLERLPELLDGVLAPGGQHVERLEAALDVHAEPAPLLLTQVLWDLGRRRGQVADVAHACQHDIIIWEKRADGTGFCWGFYNDESAHTPYLLHPRAAWRRRRICPTAHCADAAASRSDPVMRVVRNMTSLNAPTSRAARTAGRRRRRRWYNKHGGRPRGHQGTMAKPALKSMRRPIVTLDADSRLDL